MLHKHLWRWTTYTNISTWGITTYTCIPATDFLQFRGLSVKLNKDLFLERIKIHPTIEMGQDFGWEFVEILVNYAEFKSNETLVACMVLLNLVCFGKVVRGGECPWKPFEWTAKDSSSRLDLGEIHKRRALEIHGVSCIRLLSKCALVIINDNFLYYASGEFIMESYSWFEC